MKKDMRTEKFLIAVLKLLAIASIAIWCTFPY